MSDTAVTPATETTQDTPGDAAAATPNLPAAPTLPAPGQAPPAPVAPVAPALPQPGAGSIVPPAPAPTAVAEAPNLPLASPVLADPAKPMQPVGDERIAQPQQQPVEQPSDAPALPTLPDAVAAVPTTVEELAGETKAETVDADGHPMAHLMPPKSKASEASTRAAALRAEKKAKARKIKLGVAAVMLIVSVLAGPPLFSWLSNAVNEAGGTTSEEPAD